MAYAGNPGHGILWVFRMLGRPDAVTETIEGKLIDLGWDADSLDAAFEQAVRVDWIEHVGRFSVLTDSGRKAVEVAPRR